MQVPLRTVYYMFLAFRIVEAQHLFWTKRDTCRGLAWHLIQTLHSGSMSHGTTLCHIVIHSKLVDLNSDCSYFWNEYLHSQVVHLFLIPTISMFNHFITIFIICPQYPFPSYILLIINSSYSLNYSGFWGVVTSKIYCLVSTVI